MSATGAAALVVVILGAVALAALAHHLSGLLAHFESTQPQGIPFLGGHAPTTHAWQRYHLRYYPMLLLFITFEMEMMFMYPWAVVFVEQGLKALVEMGMFLAILSIGLLYAWREGVFDWQ